MRHVVGNCSLIMFIIVLGTIDSIGAQHHGIDPDALIEQIVSVDRRQSEEIRDIVFDAEYVEGETNDDGQFKEKVRFLKKIYIKRLPDTVLMKETYLEYYKDGKKRTKKDLRREAKDRREKKAKRRAKDISHSMVSPFYPANREKYNIEYLGVADEPINDHVCHHFRVDAREEDRELVDGDFYFEAEGFHLAKVEFSPARLVKKLMFKLKRLDMSVTYAPTDNGYWLPAKFTVDGRGKAALFIGVKFAGTEYYTNPRINKGIRDAVFEEDDDGS